MVGDFGDFEERKEHLLSDKRDLSGDNIELHGLTPLRSSDNHTFHGQHLYF